MSRIATSTATLFATASLATAHPGHAAPSIVHLHAWDVAMVVAAAALLTGLVRYMWLKA